MKCSSYSNKLLFHKIEFREKDAKADVLELGKARNEEVKNALKTVFLKRDKSIVLEDELPTKTQKVSVTLVFCLNAVRIMQ